MQFAPASSLAADGRRITADSFKLLTARLKNKGQIPDLFQTPEPETPVVDAVEEPIAPVPEIVTHAVGVMAEPAAESPAELDLPSHFDLPAFVPLNQEPAMPESVGHPQQLEPLAELTHPETTEQLAIPAESGEVVFAAEEQEAIPEPGRVVPDFPEFPVFGEPSTDFEPLPQPAEDAGTPGEPDILAQGTGEETTQDVLAPEPEASPWLPDQSAIGEAEPQAPMAEPTSAESQFTTEPASEPQSLSEVISTVRAPRAATPLSERVVDALVKTVTEAIYAKPSAAERAAFLREIAELVGKEEGSEPPPSSEVDEPAFETQAQSEPILPSVEELPPKPVAEEPQAIGDAIAGRLSSASPILRKVRGDDPFDKAPVRLPAERQIEELPEADEDTGETAMSLLDMMSGGHATSQPQERALAADTLLRLVPRIPAKQLLAVAERVAIMEQPPSRLVAKLIRDSRHEIAAPLLERCMHITDQDLAIATAEGDAHKLRTIARRRIISPTLSDQIIDRGDTSAILTLVRNPGASLNHDSFFRLADHATEHHAVLAPLVTRADIPAPVAFELFWHVPQELRRFILSRFLTDSENLNRILKITMAAEGGSETPSEQKFPPQEVIERAIAHAAAGKLDQASQELADVSGAHAETVLRVLSDREGEPVAVLLKTIGCQRLRFADAVAALQNGEITLLRPDRKVEELQSIFDTLSFNKARILLTYWDWHTRKAGPYAPHN